jgi:hypothetical protein
MSRRSALQGIFSAILQHYNTATFTNNKSGPTSLSGSSIVVVAVVVRPIQRLLGLVAIALHVVVVIASFVKAAVVAILCAKFKERSSSFSSASSVSYSSSPWSSRSPKPFVHTLASSRNVVNSKDWRISRARSCAARRTLK